MDSKLFSLAIAATLVAVFFSRATAQSSCTSALINLSPCLNYITGNETTPSSSCCSQLSSVVSSEPQCLCMVLNGGASQLGITINQTQAMALPGACKVQTPPASKCNSNGGSPSSSPTTPSSGSPSTPDVPSGGSGSKTTPAGGVDSSSSSSVHASFSMFIATLFFGAYLSMSSI